ncbi:M56 family metallopeptidase [Fodinibius salinus]|uniref:M56 family metallopeptidase n=1 Tax=Fodinibius salinus TaxID=860790 RepID=UPI001B87CFB7|nr:M56 family metallopeptidase [Fodinibius salinus]
MKSTLLLGLLFGIYKLLLENEKTHYFNRFFLLFSLLFGLTAPLTTFEIYPEQDIAGIKMQQMEQAVNVPAEAISNSVESAIVSEPAPLTNTETAPATPAETGGAISATDILFGLYGLVTLFLLIRFAGGLLEIRHKIKVGNHQKTGAATLVLLDKSITPQSFFRFIFLGKEQFENGEIGPKILDHELTHVRQFHTLDVLFVEFLKVIFWFNPFMYLYKRAIQLNHEFIADESIVSKISSPSDYQNMLIRACAGNKSLNLTSSINFSLTKKRLQMMFRSYSRFRFGSKTAVLVPILALLTFTFCSKEREDTAQHSQTTYSDVELHFDSNRSEELGKPIATHYTSSGEPFTGTQKIYYTENDSLHMEMYFEDGINTGSVQYEDGDTYRIKNGLYQNFPKMQEMYVNDTLVYKDIFPTKSEDGMGHIRLWHDNGQLSVEVSYTGDQVYQGLMTEYDKDGNIIKQERYEDGEVIETIK